MGSPWVLGSRSSKPQMQFSTYAPTWSLHTASLHRTVGELMPWKGSVGPSRNSVPPSLLADALRHILCAFQKARQRKASIARCSRLGNAPLYWLSPFTVSISHSQTLSSWDLISNKLPGHRPLSQGPSPGKPKGTYWRVTGRRMADSFFACSNAFKLSPLPTKVSAIFSFWQLRSSTKWPPIFCITHDDTLFLYGDITQPLTVSLMQFMFHTLVLFYIIFQLVRMLLIPFCTSKFYRVFKILIKYYHLHKAFQNLSYRTFLFQWGSVESQDSFICTLLFPFKFNKKPGYTCFLNSTEFLAA